MTLSAEQIAELLERHWGPLVAWIGPDDEAVEDIVQQGFIALAAESPPPVNPAAWLYKVTRNIAINERSKRQRRNRRHRAVARPEEEQSPLWRTAEAAEIADLLNRLPEQQREVVVARIWGGLSFEEIADATSKSRTTVWRYYDAALTNLRDHHGVTCNTKN